MQNNETTNKKDTKKAEQTQLEKTRITISIKNELTDEAFTRLEAIVASKKTLLMKSLGAKELPIIKENDKLTFPWFTQQNVDGETEAYALFIDALINMAKTQHRVTATEKNVENEKFTMRVFTVRLGLKGDKYKLTRKLLLQNLSGNASWKNGKPEPKKTVTPVVDDGDKQISPEEIAP